MPLKAWMFEQLVYRIAKDNEGPELRKVIMPELIRYLKDNWESVKDTDEGRFLREFPEWTQVPDYTLRKMYRDKILTKT